MASFILDDDASADEVVSDTIAAACRFVDQPDVREVTHARLARSVYHRCLGLLASYERFPWARPAASASNSERLGTSALTTLSISQRAAVALVLFGEHDLAAAATTLNLPPTVVATRLRDALVKMRGNGDRGRRRVDV